jgi:peptide/nickel transport system permease protein
MHYLLIRGDLIFFYLMFYLETLRMMLDQNENSEQLALIKKYGFDKPIATQYLYYINDLSPLSLHSKNEVRLHVFERGKIQCSTLFSFNLNLVIKTPYLEKVSKVERKYRK